MRRVRIATYIDHRGWRPGDVEVVSDVLAAALVADGQAAYADGSVLAILARPATAAEFDELVPDPLRPAGEDGAES